MSKVYLTQAGSFRAMHSHDGTLAEPLHEHLFRYEATFYGDINEERFLVDFRQISNMFKTDLEKKPQRLRPDHLFTVPDGRIAGYLDLRPNQSQNAATLFH